ncbi:GNAT family N-acetyltransferase [Streptomyces prasinopilosus]|uniref:Ribosomal protein S18 acetylase RimI n=1 Tax=Streptomyces prasinopilosus TaxID=67344 RepID=A0A1G6Q675_9ACTN|nr:GNAT family N-acetyltransferase [Streptomyces prasinopilosus]SDC87859.1 Ribosomal protein S18 acetylase RimI [Streptomyces prasinopilosus]
MSTGTARSGEAAGTTYGEYVVRSVRAGEWAAVKALRLAALRDPVADIAFLDTYGAAVARPDDYWRERTANAAEGTGGVRQFVAQTADGVLVGTVAVVVEEAGTTDWAGVPVEHRQGHLVGVYVAPGHRGSGVSGALFETALEWARGEGLDRVRLIVHPENARARGFYRKAGFTESGVTVPLEGRPGEHELEMAVETSGGGEPAPTRAAGPS